MERKAALDVVAVTAEAAWECQVRGWPYVAVESFGGDVAVASRADEVLAAEIAWARWVDEYLRRQIDLFQKTSFCPAAASFTTLQWVWNGALESWSWLSHLLKSLQPRTVLYRPWTEAPTAYLRHSRPPYSVVLPDLARQMGISLVEIAGSPDPGQPGVGEPLDGTFQRATVSRQGALGRGIRSSQIWREFRLVRGVGWRRWLEGLLRQIGSAPAVLVLADGYDLDPIAATLRTMAVRVQWSSRMGAIGDGRSGVVGQAPSRDVRGMMERLWPGVQKRPEFWSPLELVGASANDQLLTSLGHWWSQEVPELWASYQAGEALLRKGRFRAVLGYESGVTRAAAVLQAARNCGARTVICQHGSTARIRLGEVYSYLMSCDLFLTYGEGTTQHVRAEYERFCGKRSCGRSADLVTVGSPRLESIRESMNGHRRRALRRRLRGRDRRPIVLYVATNLGMWGSSLSCLTGYPDVSYFELQERVLRLFAQFPGVRLLYKDSLSHNVVNPIPDLIRREIPNGQTIWRPSFAALVWGVDAVVLDYPITALGEALLTDRPVVVYSPYTSDKGLEPSEARALLRKRATVAGTPEEFVTAVRELLERGVFSLIEGPDSTFLQRFGTHVNNGRAALRAAEAVVGTPTSTR